MTLDAVVGAIILLFALHGLWRGLLRKLAGIASLVIASLAAGYVGSELASYAAQRWQVSSPAVTTVCIMVGWIVLFIVCRIVLGFIARKLGSTEGGKPASWNRWLGALFGALEAGVPLWFLVGVADAIPEDVRATSLPRLHEEMKHSVFATFTHETSPLAYLELKPLIEDFAVIYKKPQVLQELAQEREVHALLSNPQVKEILQDRELMGELQQGRYVRFLTDRKVRDALEDPSVRQLLRAATLRRLVHEAALRARQPEGGR
jgi:uncharacterized membrane protein required for colicin V production